MDWDHRAELIVVWEAGKRVASQEDREDMAQEGRLACWRLLLRKPDADERFLRVAARGAMSDWRRAWTHRGRAPTTRRRLEAIDQVDWLAAIDARVYFEELRSWLPPHHRSRLDALLRTSTTTEAVLRPIRRDIMRRMKKLEEQLQKAPDRGRWIRPLDDVITAYVQEALTFFDGDCAATARALKIGRATIYRWIDEGRVGVASKSGARKTPASQSGSAG